MPASPSWNGGADRGTALKLVCGVGSHPGADLRAWLNPYNRKSHECTYIWISGGINVLRWRRVSSPIAIGNHSVPFVIEHPILRLTIGLSHGLSLEFIKTTKQARDLVTETCRLRSLPGVGDSKTYHRHVSYSGQAGGRG